MMALSLDMIATAKLLVEVGAKFTESECVAAIEMIRESDKKFNKTTDEDWIGQIQAWPKRD
jgi:hypothetical protein